jgi:glucosamine--fructose-6-phosphate aminotransferase (isomerizing)
MCGIVGYTGSRDAVPILLAGLRRLEYRGYDSAGVAVLAHPPEDPASPRIAIVRCTGKIAALESRLAETPVDGHTGIGHTRWATHGRPSDDNAHPHSAGRVAVVHNGILENYKELRAELIARGRTFTSETDTEIVAHLVDEAMTRGLDLHAATRDAISRLRGAWALAVTSATEPASIVVARHAAPLLLGLGDPAHPAETFVASDVSAILSYTRNVVDLDDGDTALVKPGEIEIRDASGEVVQRPRRRVEWSPTAAEKQGYRHFMLKEIHEQPRVIRDTLLGRLDEHTALADLDLELADDARILVLGCGTSWHAGLAAKHFIESLARIPVEVDLASEFRYRDPVVKRGDLAIAISQSGETADTLAALKEAKARGASTLAICNVVDASLARAADRVLYTHAGPEISVASTKAFTTQLALLLVLAMHLGRRRGTLSDARHLELVDALRSLPVALDVALGLEAQTKIVARRHGHARDVLYLGRGLAHAVALEGALKLKEISYVHAEGYAAGEMKHGPIALVDENVPVVVLALEGPAYDKTLSNLEEVRARGGKIVAVANLGDSHIADLADDVLLVPRVDPLLAPIVASIPLQLLAYHVAVHKGTDVDQPRNLAKSVTVE